jgi:REP element-mobilizing transposase RayT
MTVLLLHASGVHSFHGKNLRKGRSSRREQIYLVTTVTKGRAACFAELALGRIVVNSLRWCDDNGLAETWCFVVMPDHLHWLLGLRGSASLSELVGNVKRFTSSQIGKRRGKSAGVWQAGFHDHAIRHEESLREVARYVVLNPVRAGLVRTVRYYPLWDAKWL